MDAAPQDNDGHGGVFQDTLIFRTGLDVKVVLHGGPQGCFHLGTCGAGFQLDKDPAAVADGMDVSGRSAVTDALCLEILPGYAVREELGGVLRLVTLHRVEDLLILADHNRLFPFLDGLEINAQVRGGGLIV